MKHKQKRNQRFTTPTPFSAMLPKATHPHTFRTIVLTLLERAKRNSAKGVGARNAHYAKRCRGFTLVELLVSFAIFTLVITGSIGAMAAVIDANRKTQSLQLVINNLNFALESMTRSIRIGYQYHCTSDIPGNLSTFSETRDCPGGGTYLAFESSQGNRNDNLDQVVFRHIGTRIERSIDSGQNWFPITAAEVSINELRFIALGTGSSDNAQPIVTIIINGSSGISRKATTDLRIQTSVSQRIIDF